MKPDQRTREIPVERKMGGISPVLLHNEQVMQSCWQDVVLFTLGTGDAKSGRTYKHDRSLSECSVVWEVLPVNEPGTTRTWHERLERTGCNEDVNVVSTSCSSVKRPFTRRSSCVRQGRTRTLMQLSCPSLQSRIDV